MKLTLKILFALAIGIAAIIPASAQQDDPNDPQIRIPKDVPAPQSNDGLPREISKSCNDFFRALVGGNPDAAFQKMLGTSPLGNKKDQAAKRVETFNKAVEVYGAVKGHEFAGSDAVSESLVKVKYITLHEQFPLRWFFTFYKSPVRGWTIINMTFDDDVEYLFPKN
jgi:hypothetical protein